MTGVVGARVQAAVWEGVSVSMVRSWTGDLVRLVVRAVVNLAVRVHNVMRGRSNGLPRVSKDPLSTRERFLFLTIFVVIFVLSARSDSTGKILEETFTN